MGPNLYLEDQIKSYHQKRYIQWRTILGISIVVFISTLSICTIYCIVLLREVRKKNLILSTEYTKLTTKWQDFLKTSRQLKMLILEEEFHKPNKLGKYLQAISEAIPQQTLLTRLTFKDPHLTLEGYTESLEELSIFLHHLAQKKIVLNLKQSYHKGPVIFFELTNKPTSSQSTLKGKKAHHHDSAKKAPR